MSMTSSLLPGNPMLSTKDARLDLTIKSGPGAIMFEPGAHTRIRRAPVRAIATYRWAHGAREAFGQVLNISPGGCLLKTETTIPLGTEIELQVMLVGGQRRITADVRGVIRRQTKCEGRQAYGVEFISKHSDERELLQWLYMQAMR